MDKFSKEIAELEALEEMENKPFPQTPDKRLPMSNVPPLCQECENNELVYWTSRQRLRVYSCSIGLGRQILIDFNTCSKEELFGTGYKTECKGFKQIPKGEDDAK